MNYRCKLINTSLRQVLCKSDLFTEYFISHLKKEVPHLEKLLDSMDVEKFQFELMGNITIVVANLDNILMLESYLHDIAYQLYQQHITADDIPHIIEAFTQALHEVSDLSWDKQTYLEWDNLLRRTLHTVRAGISHSMGAKQA